MTPESIKEMNAICNANLETYRDNQNLLEGEGLFLESKKVFNEPKRDGYTGIGPVIQSLWCYRKIYQLENQIQELKNQKS